MYDISKMSTFLSIERWLRELRDHADPDIVVLLVGNKSDLTNQREVEYDHAMEFAKERNLFFVETSALRSSNVDTAFKSIVNQIYSITKSSNAK